MFAISWLSNLPISDFTVGGDNKNTSWSLLLFSMVAYTHRKLVMHWELNLSHLVITMSANF